MTIEVKRQNNFSIRRAVTLSRSSQKNGISKVTWLTGQFPRSVLILGETP
jgi:hypothetical protein